MTDTRFKRIEKKKTQELISYDHSVWKDIKKELFSNKIADRKSTRLNSSH